MQRFTRAGLGDGLSWWDVLGLSLLAGSVQDEHAKIGVLAGSVIAALAGVVLRMRNRHYRRLCAVEEADTDADGVPDVYQTGSPQR